MITRVLRVIVFWAVFSDAVGYGSACAVEPDITLFDVLITKEVIAHEFGPKAPLDFSVTEAYGEVRHFIAEYRFNRRSSTEHYAGSVTEVLMQ